MYARFLCVWVHICIVHTSWCRWHPRCPPLSFPAQLSHRPAPVSASPVLGWQPCSATSGFCKHQVLDHTQIPTLARQPLCPLGYLPSPCNLFFFFLTLRVLNAFIISCHDLRKERTLKPWVWKHRVGRRAWIYTHVSVPGQHLLTTGITDFSRLTPRKKHTFYSRSFQKNNCYLCKQRLAISRFYDASTVVQSTRLRTFCPSNPFR